MMTKTTIFKTPQARRNDANLHDNEIANLETSNIERSPENHSNHHLSRKETVCHENKSAFKLVFDSHDANEDTSAFKPVLDSDNDNDSDWTINNNDSAHSSETENNVDSSFECIHCGQYFISEFHMNKHINSVG